MKINLKLALVVVSAALLAACGGSDSPPVTKVATADTTVPASAATTAVVAKLALPFPSGVPELGTTGATALTFTAPTSGTSTLPNFTIDTPGVGTAAGATAFGSCIFNVSSSSFPASHPLATGKSVKVEPCEIKINTKGMAANGITVKRKLKIKLGNTESTEQDVDVNLDTNGNVNVNGGDVGNTPVQEVTGGSS